MVSWANDTLVNPSIGGATSAKPTRQTVRTNGKGKQTATVKEGEAPVSKHQAKLRRVRWASRRGEGEPTPPRETKNSGANGQELKDTSFCTKKKKNLLEKRGGEGERDGAQHDDKRATTVTDLAEGNSSSLPITCGRWL